MAVRAMFNFLAVSKVMALGGIGLMTRMGFVVSHGLSWRWARTNYGAGAETARLAALLKGESHCRKGSAAFPQLLLATPFFLCPRAIEKRGCCATGGCGLMAI